ncbi:hypothetical protein [Candidatus Uabimicrobium sp. HlEnr_7]|uniref:hypothetical protein n=1 Tax=Candidatus Uabimicrobium helgolandensis TaxID=3095367 RepID=UPI003555F58A
MSITTITFLFVFLQILITSVKVVIEELVVDEDVAHYAEFAACILLGIIYYFTIVPKSASPVVCWFLASIFGIVMLVVSWGLPKLADHFLGWGESDISLPPAFTVINAWILLLCFLPTGLGATIGLPNLFSGKITFFIVIALTQLVTTCLILFITYYFEDTKTTLAMDGLLSIAIAVLVWSLLNEQNSRGQATFLTFVIVIAINIELIGIFYFAAHYLEITEIDEFFWKTRSYIFSSQLLAVIIVYFFPLLEKIFSFLDSIVS